MEIDTDRNRYQELFVDVVLGVLIYAAVLGFFNDYTDILSTTSYSTTFLTAFVMQLLTVATFALKGKIKSSFKKRGHEKITPKLVLTLWLVLFFSKFVFLGVLNFLFGENLEISGFIGLVIIIATATALQQLLEFSYRRLS